MKLNQFNTAARNAYLGALVGETLFAGIARAGSESVPTLSDATLPRITEILTLVLSSPPASVYQNAVKASNGTDLRIFAMPALREGASLAPLHTVPSTEEHRTLVSRTSTNVEKAIKEIGIDPHRAKDELFYELPKEILFAVGSYVAGIVTKAFWDRVRKHRELHDLANATAYGSAVIERVVYNRELRTVEMVQSGPGQCIRDLWKVYSGAPHALSAAAKRTTRADPFLRIHTKFVNAIYCQLRRIVQGADSESLRKAHLLRQPVLRIPVVVALASERVQGERNGKRMQILIVEETLIRELQRDKAFFKRGAGISFLRNGVPLREELVEARMHTLNSLAEVVPAKREALIIRTARKALSVLPFLRPELSHAYLMTEQSFAVPEREFRETIQRWQRESHSRDKGVAHTARVLLSAQDNR